MNILKLQGKSTKFLTDPNLEFRSIRLALSLASLVRPPARHLPVAGFRYAVRRAALHPRKNPSATAVRRSPVPCARRPRSRLGIPARLRWSGGRHRFRQASSLPFQARRSPRPSRFRLCLRSSMPGETSLVESFLHNQSASTGPASFLAEPDHASSFSIPRYCSKKPPPRLKCQPRSRPDRRHASFRQTPRRRISDNI